MAKLRKIQFYRNGQVQSINEGGEIGQQNYNVDDLKSAYVYAEALFKNTEKYKDMLDGEILLYRFSYAGQVHTLVGVVHVSGDVHSLEVLANYDMLGAEISNEIAAAIAELDGSATIATVNDNVVTLKAGIVQTDGKVSQGTGDDIVLAKVAKTGKAEDVSIADTEGVITATTVEGALAEIATDIDAMYLVDTDVVALNTEKTALQAGKISESDGKVAVADVETLVEFNQALTNGNKVATMADVTAAAEVDGENAIVVTPKTDAQGDEIPGNIVSLKIAETDNVLTQSEAGLLANIELTYDSVAKKIKLFGKEGNTAATASLGEIDATDFIKDGMLADAEIITASNEQGLTPGHRYIKFTFKTYQQGQEGVEEVLKVEYLDVESLIDSYTSGNAWIEIDQTTNKISHKEFFTEEKQKGSVTTAEADTANESVEFAVPTIKIDEAGHVIAISDNTVKVTLPASIATAVQTVTSTEEVNDTDKFVAVQATRAEGSNDVVLTSELKTQEIATATAENNGLATALDVKNYVDTNSTTVSGYTKTTGEGESAVSTVVTVVESTENTNGSTNYQVKLPEITVQTPDATENSMDNNTSTHTYMTGIETDGFGRVTKVITETMREDFDAGTY